MLLVSLGMLCLGTLGRAATNRSAYIPYNLGGNYSMSVMALDTAHQQIFTAWQYLDRVDVLSTVDYHLIRSITVPSPNTLDISPDGATIAVGNSVATILFFSTTTYAKTGEYVLPGMGLGITSLVYTATGDLIVTAANGSTSSGITTYWNHFTNAEQNYGGYLSGAPAQLTRSSDYTRIMIASIDEGGVQIVDGTTGLPIYNYLAGGMVSAVAVNRGGSRYAICASDVAGYTPSLMILDANFDVIYQRVTFEGGTDVNYFACYGIFFSADGNTLYGDTYSNNTQHTQAIDMNTFDSTFVADYFTGLPPTPTTFTDWQAADSTGMVFGVGPGTSSDGPVWLAQDMTATTPPTVPLQPYQYPVQIIRVVDSIGSPQGGDSIDLLCTGLSNIPVSDIQVTIGGKAATVVANPLQTNYPPYQTITVTTPPGTPGVVDVTLQSMGSTSTASKAFQYAQSRTIYPFATSPTFLAYDSVRQLLYAAHGNQVEVIDAINQKVLAPLIPVSGKSTNSQFAGISLSPDSNRLWIADAGANLIHMIGLANPGTGYDIDPGKAIGSSTPISPGRVIELSNGQLLGSNGTLFLINPGTMSGDWARDTLGNPIRGYAWNSTNAGENVLLTYVSDGLIPSESGSVYGSFGLWNVNTGINVPANPMELPTASEWGMSFEASANEDGTVIGSSLSVEGTIPTEQFADFSLNAIGTLYEESSDPMSDTGGTGYGAESSVLHPSGALFYQAGNHNSGVVDIADVQHMQSIGIVAFPEHFPYLDVSLPNNIYQNHILTIDPTGQYLFSVTASGITEMVLNTVPLSIGNVQPAFVPAPANQTITIRGSGFQQGSVVSFGGVPVATTFVDVNTLTATPPALTAGWTDVTATLPGGATYTAPGLLHVIGQETAPALTGFSPTAIIFGNLGTITVTLFGSSFDISDTVEVNGLPVPSAFIDSSHMQASINISLSNQAGSSIALEVVSPYAGASNTLSLPIVNPAPSIQSTYPVSLPAGGADTDLFVVGINFVPSSVVQLNGQNLSTQIYGGMIGNNQPLWATVPSNLLQNAGTATITVENPAPGGGLSNSLSINISAAQAQANLPASIDFGEVPPNTTSTLHPFLTSVGSVSYTVTSVTVTPGPFTVQALNCTGLSAGKACSLVVTFTPTSAAPYTGTLTITDNSVGSPHTIPLTGTGIISTAPTVTLTSIDDVWPSTSVFVTGNAYSSGISSGISVGFPATAWMEYGTDPTLSTFTASSSWSASIGGDQNQASPVTGVLPLSNLQPATTYAMRLAVQTAGGTGRSAIHQFATYQNLTTRGFSVSGTPVTVTPGATSGNTSTITVTPGGGFTGSVILSTTYSGPNVAQIQDPPTFSFGSTSPVNITGTTAVTATLTVYTTAPSTARMLYPARPRTPWYVTGGATLACILLFGIPARRCSWRTMLGILALLVVLSDGVIACGGGGNAGGGGGGGGNSNSGTTAGTYTITLTGTSGTTTATSIVLLTVQ
jgi:hypothetical protein